MLIQFSGGCIHTDKKVMNFGFGKSKDWLTGDYYTQVNLTVNLRDNLWRVVQWPWYSGWRPHAGPLYPGLTVYRLDSQSFIIDHSLWLFPKLPFVWFVFRFRIHLFPWCIIFNSSLLSQVDFPWKLNREH